MPTFEQLQAEVEKDYLKARSETITANAKANLLEAKFAGYMDADARDYWEDYHEAIFNAIRYIIGSSFYIYQYALLDWMEKAQDEQFNGVMSMDDILNAMLSADNDQLTKFIGIVDAYRMSIWNQSFNVEFYAALARGFAIWE